MTAGGVGAATSLSGTGDGPATAGRHEVVHGGHDVRGRFTGGPAADDVVERRPTDELAAPGGGPTHPCDFALVSDRATRQRVHRPQVGRHWFESSLPPESPGREPTAQELPGVPEAIRPVASLRLGPVTHLEQVPDPERTGWRRRPPHSEIMHRGSWARPVELAT